MKTELLVKPKKLIGKIANQYPSPLYAYDFGKISRQFDLLEEFLPANFQVHYTLKANS